MGILKFIYREVSPKTVMDRHGILISLIKVQDPKIKLTILSNELVTLEYPHNGDKAAFFIELKQEFNSYNFIKRKTLYLRYISEYKDETIEIQLHFNDLMNPYLIIEKLLSNICLEQSKINKKFDYFKKIRTEIDESIQKELSEYQKMAIYALTYIYTLSTLYGEIPYSRLFDCDTYFLAFTAKREDLIKEVIKIRNKRAINNFISCCSKSKSFQQDSQSKEEFVFILSNWGYTKKEIKSILEEGKLHPIIPRKAKYYSGNPLMATPQELNSDNKKSEQIKIKEGRNKKVETEVVIFIEDWKLMDFYGKYRKVQIGSFTNKYGIQFKACIFTSPEGTKTFVNFLSDLGELSPLEMKERKNSLYVGKTQNGDYYLYSKDNKGWALSSPTRENSEENSSQYSMVSLTDFIIMHGNISIEECVNNEDGHMDSLCIFTNALGDKTFAAFSPYLGKVTLEEIKEKEKDFYITWEEEGCYFLCTKDSEEYKKKNNNEFAYFMSEDDFKYLLHQLNNKHNLDNYTFSSEEH